MRTHSFVFSNHETNEKVPYGSFLFVCLIEIRPGRVSYHDQVQVQGLKGEKGGKDLGRGSFGGLGGF